MPANDWILDPASLDLENPIADLEAIRKLNRQRGLIEQLTAIVFADAEAGIVAGYKDIAQDEFWVEGHMPGMPLMPGVLMCEAAAQICSYFVIRNDLLGCEVLGFGGLDEVRFRGAVVPGDRLIVVAQQIQVRRNAMIRCKFQCFVNNALVCEGQLRGIPIPVEALKKSQAEK